MTTYGVVVFVLPNSSFNQSAKKWSDTISVRQDDGNRISLAGDNFPGRKPKLKDRVKIVVDNKTRKITAKVV